MGLAHKRHLLPKDVITNVVEALVISHVMYCMAVIYPMGEVQKRRLERILNFAAGVISGRHKFDHISDVRSELGWLSISEAIQYREGLLMYKIINNGTPLHLFELFTTNSSVHGRHTRQSDELHLPRVRTEAGKSAYSYRGGVAWNSFPSNVRSTISVSAWKKAAKTHINTLKGS